MPRSGYGFAGLTVAAGVKCAQGEAAERQGSQMVALAVKRLQTADRAQVQGVQAVVPKVHVRHLAHDLQAVVPHPLQPV